MKSLQLFYKLVISLTLLFFSNYTLAEVTIEAPSEVHAGETIVIKWQGPNNSGDFITLVEAGTPEGQYQTYTYLSNNRNANIIAAAKPGNYELRYAAGSGYKTLARTQITILESNTTLKSAPTARVGEMLSVDWSGPNASGDFISVTHKDGKEGSYLKYSYTSYGSPAKVRVPLEPGDYEVRYSSGNRYATLARIPLKVIANNVSVSSVPSALSGSTVSVKWVGPNSDGDFISAVKKGARNGAYETYTYLNQNPASLVLPEGEGEYEIRYASGDGYKTLASTTITLTAATASMKVLEPVYTNRPFKVEWQGPNNERDYITIVKAGAKEKTWLSYTYTRWGNPLSIQAPKEAGDYELRYATGSSYTTLARIPVKVLASKTPGTLYVSQAISTSSSGGQTGNSNNAVEIILDASGSMLKKQNGQRRIDIAKQALETLIDETLPDKASVAIRAFGHIKADSCDGEIVLPLSPLNKQQALRTINSVTPKNLAKTPIAASLEMVEKDLAMVDGMRKVILVTDGEETCNGDPEQVIKSLKEKGINVQINIVGFAIDDFGLKQTFQKWAELGNGRYFDANDKQELAKTIQEATKRTYQVLTPEDRVISSGTVNGSPIDLLPGKYKIKLDKQMKTVEIKSDERSSVSF